MDPVLDLQRLCKVVKNTVSAGQHSNDDENGEQCEQRV